MAIFKGAGVAIVTPFNQDYSVDYQKLSELIEFQISEGSDAIIVCGTTGEASTLTHEEQLNTIRYTVEAVAGRIPVVAGAGSNCTDTAVYLSQGAEKAGADALLHVTPYYNKGTQKGLYEHYKIIADSVSLPIILYNVPSRTNFNISAETTVDLVTNVENIVGIKEASGDFTQIARLMHLAKGKVDLYSGNDEQIIPILSLGGVGVISTMSNIIPKQTHDMCQKFFDGEIALSSRMQLDISPLRDALFCEVNPIPVKKALQLMGMYNGTLRRPLTEMEAPNIEKLKKAMQGYGLLS